VNRLSLAHFLLFGVFAWGVPGVLVAGPQAVALTLMVAIPLWWAARRSTDIDRVSPARVRPSTSDAVLAFALAYLVLDATFGRQKFEINLFLFSEATGQFIDQANDTVGQGRGFIELVGALLLFLPFALIDAARQAPHGKRAPFWIVGLLLVFYEIGISRGFLLIAVIAVLLGSTIRLGRLLLATSASLAVFVAASVARGDFAQVSFANPLFDAVAWPYINLALLLNTDCGSGDSSLFALEFLKKFMPAVLVSKDVFSFNIEMTRCIYPFFGEEVGSISIFTYLGELFYYKPSLVTALSAGVLLAALARLVDRLLVRSHLLSVRLFAGLLCIVLLRSRVLDVLSFLIFLSIFLVGWRLFQRRHKRRKADSTPSAKLNPV
jgi:hypothetical protein